MSDANGVGTWSTLAGSWFGVLAAGSGALGTPVNFTTGTVAGIGGSADVGADVITVPTTGLYEITISGWTQGSSSPYLTVWEIKKNGTTLSIPHYASPSASWGTQVSTTIYSQLDAGDQLTLTLAQRYAGTSGNANSALAMSFAVKLINGNLNPPTPGTISALNCAGATHNGTLTANSSASGVSSVISYTGGNGGVFSSQSVSSTGVTGLTATISGGSFATGNGNLTYTITGTPSSVGNASFTITIGGQSCTITRTVGAPVAGAIASLNCAGATHNGTLSAGVAASGVNSVISYTGGNGGTHAAQSVTSTGVTGLTATVSAGSFANGNGTLTYTITGTPSGSGTASFAINIGGKTCTITRTVTASVLPACTAEGYYANPNDPHQYYRCVQQSTQFIRYQYTCPNGNIYVAAPNGAQGKCVAP